MCFFFPLLSTWISSDRFWNKSSLWKFYCNQRRENMTGICTHSFWYQSLLLRTVRGLPPNLPFLTIVDVEMKLVMLNSRDFDISRCLKVENIRNILSYSLFWTCARLFETLDTEYCTVLRSRGRSVAVKAKILFTHVWSVLIDWRRWNEILQENWVQFPKEFFFPPRWPQCRCVGSHYGCHDVTTTRSFDRWERENWWSAQARTYKS